MAIHTVDRNHASPRSIRTTVTQKTAPDPKIMSEYSGLMLDMVQEARNMIIPQVKLRMAIWKVHDKVHTLTFACVV